MSREVHEEPIQREESISKDLKGMNEGSNSDRAPSYVQEEETPKRAWWHSVKDPGSALQIVIAAALAIAIGMAVTSTVDDIPEAASTIIAIPGVLWLRCLRAIVLPLIVSAMILAVQRLKEMAKGGALLARWTVGYFVATTLVAIVHSTLMVSLVWTTLMTQAAPESLVVSGSDAEVIAEREKFAIHIVVANMFESFIPANVVYALSSDSLLAVLITSIVVGYLIKGPDSSLLRATMEIEKLITTIITFLIKISPIGVFFLILPNLFRLDIADIGLNLGVLIGGAIGSMFLHLFIILPAIYFFFLRKNPWAYWFKNSPAWITAWGTASSAGTLPVTLKCSRARGVPETICKFVVPLGCLINMDGTACYFPIAVVFLATTQGITLNGADYVVICLLSTLASIGTTPIPSSSLVLIVMIASSVNVPITGMYAVIVAIDWFLDRFRTAVNVSGDLFAAAILAKITGIVDTEDVDVYDGEDEISNNGNRV